MKKTILLLFMLPIMCIGQQHKTKPANTGNQQKEIDVAISCKTADEAVERINKYCAQGWTVKVIISQCVSVSTAIAKYGYDRPDTRIVNEDKKGDILIVFMK